MPISTTKTVKRGIDPNAYTTQTPKRSSPPAPNGVGGMSVAKKPKAGIDPEAFTREIPKRSNPPQPKL